MATSQPDLQVISEGHAMNAGRRVRIFGRGLLAAGGLVLLAMASQRQQPLYALGSVLAAAAIVLTTPRVGDKFRERVACVHDICPLLRQRQFELMEGLYNFEPKEEFVKRAVFTRLILYPGADRSRIGQMWDYRESPPTRRTDIEIAPNWKSFRLGASDEAQQYVPVMRPYKGKLTRNLSIRDASGGSVSALNTGEVTDLMVRVGRDLFCRAFALSDYPGHWSRCHRELFLVYIKILLERPQGEVDNFDKRYQRREHASDRLFKASKRLELVPSSEADFNEFVRLSSLVSTNYVVVAELPRRSRYQLTYTQNAPVFTRTAKTSEGPTRRLLGWLRYLNVSHDAVPTNLEVSMEQAKSCGGLHVAIRVPIRMHVASIWFVEEDGLAVPKIRKLKHNLHVPHFRRSGLGTSEGYFYCRNISEKPRPRLQLRMSIYETPPGSMGRASLVAFACTVAVLGQWAYTASRGTEQSGPGLAAVTIAAIPIAAAQYAWVGGRRSDVVPTLLSRMSSLVSLLVILAGAALTARYSSTFEGTNHSAGWRDDLHMVMSTYPWSWQLLFYASLFNFALTATIMLCRLRRWHYLISRPDLRDA